MLRAKKKQAAHKEVLILWDIDSGYLEFASTLKNC